MSAKLHQSEAERGAQRINRSTAKGGGGKRESRGTALALPLSISIADDERSGAKNKMVEGGGGVWQARQNASTRKGPTACMLSAPNVPREIKRTDVL